MHIEPTRTDPDFFPDQGGHILVVGFTPEEAAVLAQAAGSQIAIPELVATILQNALRQLKDTAAILAHQQQLPSHTVTIEQAAHAVRVAAVKTGNPFQHDAPPSAPKP